MRGVCKVCGCTEMDPCFNPDYGCCWWVDDSHELCSHCADKDIADDPRTEHCVNSKNGMMDDDEYICVNVIGPHPEGASPCDYCEREPCIGVEICEDEYGQDCCFIRRSEYEKAE